MLATADSMVVIASINCCCYWKGCYFCCDKRNKCCYCGWINCFAFYSIRVAIAAERVAFCCCKDCKSYFQNCCFCFIMPLLLWQTAVVVVGVGFDTFFFSSWHCRCLSCYTPLVAIAILTVDSVVRVTNVIVRVTNVVVRVTNVVVRVTNVFVWVTKVVVSVNNVVVRVSNVVVRVATAVVRVASAVVRVASAV